jgi:hypothetical protein
VNNRLLALIALELAAVAAMFARELFRDGARYRSTVETLLLERTLRERVNSRRHVVGAGREHRQHDEDEGEDLLHALNATAAVGQHRDGEAVL